MVFFGVPYDDHCLSHWLLTNALLAQHIICSIRFHILIVSVMLNNKQTYPLGIQNTYGKPSMLYNVIYKSGKSSNRPCSIVFHSHPFEFPVCRHRARPMDPRHQYEWHMGDLGWWPNLRWSGESHWWKMGKKNIWVRVLHLTCALNKWRESETTWKIHHELHRLHSDLATWG